MNNILVISSYDNGYVFSIQYGNYKLKYDYFDKIDDEIAKICYKYISNDKELIEKLKEINIKPDCIIICEDGYIHILHP